MSQITIKTNKAHRRGREVTFEGLKVKFDDFLMAEIPERYIKQALDSGYELVDEKEVEKYSKLKEELEKSKSESTKPDIDFHSENLKLKEENSLLKKRIEQLELELVEKLSPDVNVTETDDETDEALNSLKLDELKALCEERNFPKADWGGKKEAALRTYIKSKIEAEEK